MSSSAAFGAFDVVDRVEVVVSLSGVALDEVEVFGTFRGLPGRFLAGAMFEAWEVDAPPLSEFIKNKISRKNVCFDALSFSNNSYNLFKIQLERLM